MLIRRLVEECALQRVSSIVLDPNNDLSRLGLPWPDIPEGRGEGDAEKAKTYFEQTEVTVWTPRLSAGRPLSFAPLSDLASVTSDPDEFSLAIDNAVAMLVPHAGLPTTGGKSVQGRAVLKEALRAYTEAGGSGLKGFLDFLSALPAGVSQLDHAENLAANMAQNLIAATVNDPMFGGEGEAVDPATLLTPPSDKRARVSVINLTGLPNDDQRQSFVNQLQMALFSWVKRIQLGSVRWEDCS